MELTRPIERECVRIEPLAQRSGVRFRRSRVGFGRALCAAWVLTLAACASQPAAGPTAAVTTPSSPAAIPTQRVAILAKAGAFEPAKVRLVQGVPAVLEFTRVAESACMEAVRMPWMDEAVDLPMNETIEISVDTSLTGVFSYACWMDMVFGDVVIDKAG